jgi:hypothetical protein
MSRAARSELRAFAVKTTLCEHYGLPLPESAVEATPARQAALQN